MPLPFSPALFSSLALSRRRFLVAGLLAATALLALPAAAEDYVTLPTPQNTDVGPGKIEVIEFFSYACPHCAKLAPKLAKWESKLGKDVVFRRVPVSWDRPAWTALSQLYYTLEATGELAKLDGEVFKAVHDDHVNLFSESAAKEWYVKHGGDGAKFSTQYKSFSVVSKVNRAVQIAAAYKVDGVPRLIVDGRYQIEAGNKPGVSEEAGHDQMLATADKLIDKVRAEARGKKK